MMNHPTATREQWLAARLELLKEEKELTRRSDELAEKRRNLPWVPVEKEYHFTTPAGPATLGDLFQGRSQLLVYHFMFGPDYTAGCPSCSAIADGFAGIVPHLAHHDVLLTAVSLAPIEKLEAFRKRMGWTFPWASAAGGDFNEDFCASYTEDQQAAGLDYNYTREPQQPWRNGEPGGGEGAEFQFATLCGVTTPAYLRQRPGMSAFVRKDGVIHHTYSTYARGLDSLWNMYQWLDRAPLGRNEADGVWWLHHDQYSKTPGTPPPSC
ncbi:MAG: DUF899 domain-containing protein, partial [Verrucomicrobiaceae bacterium]